MVHYLFAPLLASGLYALASLLVKRAFIEGATTAQAFHSINIVIAAVLLPLPLFEDSSARWDLWFQPAIVGAAFFGGTWLAAEAIRRGDVSLVTPVSAIKVIVVALLVGFLIGEWVSPFLWGAAVIASIGVAVLAYRGGGIEKAPMSCRPAILAMLFSVILLGTGDVLIQKWASPFGAFTFVTLAAVAAALYSLVALGLTPQKYLRPPWQIYGWLAAGGAIAGIQSAMMGLALAFANDAVGIHVIYSLRGIWAVLLAALIGGRLGVGDGVSTSPMVFRRRAIGALMVTVAVLITIAYRTSSG